MVKLLIEKKMDLAAMSTHLFHNIDHHLNTYLMINAFPYEM